MMLPKYHCNLGVLNTDILDYINTGGTLPDFMDLRSLCSPVENQGSYNSCTTFGIIGLMEFLEIKEKRQFVDLSHLFLFRAEHAAEGTLGKNEGAAIIDGIKCVETYGVCTEELWPYVDANFDVNPPPMCYADALTRKVIATMYISSVEDVKDCIASGYPVTCGIEVHESLESDYVASTGIIPIPQPGEQILGGHCIVVVGFLEEKQCWIVRNSWGPNWGDNGYCYLPYAYQLQDCFTIRKME